MKRISKIKLLLLSIGIIFLTLASYYNNFNSVQIDQKNDLDVKLGLNLKTPNPSKSWILNNITIDGSATGVGARNWSRAVAEGWCSGSGTVSDPYVIENITIIDGVLDNGILIGNSSVYFRIKNCTIINSGSGSPNAGIKLINVNNGTIINNNCTKNFFGIYMENCTNNTISGNSLNKNRDGINLLNSNFTDIMDNNITKNNDNGIYINQCNNITISKN